jgi:hypothetical protein
MRAAAEAMAHDLASAREELRRAVFELPEETKENAAAMRKVVADQISALNALSDVVKRHTNMLDVSTPQDAVVEQRLAASGSAFPARAQQAAQQPVQQAPAPVRAAQVAEAPRAPAPAPQQADPGLRGSDTGKWGLSDLLTAASRDEETLPALSERPGKSAKTATPVGTGNSPEVPRLALHIVETLNSLSVDLVRSLDHKAPEELWVRYQNGERNVFTRRLYSMRGQRLFDEIARRYRKDAEFHDDVDRYVDDFERLLDSVAENDRDNMLVETYLSSETGKVYLMLAHASGRMS